MLYENAIYQKKTQRISKITSVDKHSILLRSQTINDAIRVELCPAFYKPIDYLRARSCGGGIGLLYKDSAGD